MDQIAIQAFRETLRNIYNHYLQGMPVGPQDVSGPCPLGVGTVQVSGTATSNADQGTTEVDLTFVLTQCLFAEMATDPTHTYTMTLTGTATEKGTLAVQPSANTALTIQSDAMTFSGTVHDPPLNYQANACPLALVQDGNQLSGTVCGRQAGTSL